MAAPYQYILLICIVFFNLGLSCQAKETNNYPAFLVFADIHFDPFSYCPRDQPHSCKLLNLLQQTPIQQWTELLAVETTDIAKTGQDTNFALLTTSLGQAKKTTQTEQLKFILVLGDSLGHRFKEKYYRYANHPSEKDYRIFVKKTLMFINKQIASHFSGIDLYLVIGNNDSYETDYHLKPGGIFFQDLSIEWPRFIHLHYPTQRKRLIQASLQDSGYYAVDVFHQTNLRLILLNSVLFSKRVKGPHVVEAANRELKWLHQELNSAKVRHQKVFIAMHIPPFIDVNVSGIHLFNVMDLWQKVYKERFQQLLQDFSSSIEAILTAHLHITWTSRWILKENQTIPILGNPSVSPIFSNTPGFSVYHYYPQSGQLIDYSIYYFSKEKIYKMMNKSING